MPRRNGFYTVFGDNKKLDSSSANLATRETLLRANEELQPALLKCLAAIWELLFDVGVWEIGLQGISKRPSNGTASSGKSVEEAA